MFIPLTISVKDVNLKEAVLSLKNLPLNHNSYQDCRYIIDQQKFYLWTQKTPKGLLIHWKPIELKSINS
jgi:hypothetical protein